MVKRKTDRAHRKKVLTALDALLDMSAWDKGLFLGNIKKKLIRYRELLAESIEGDIEYDGLLPADNLATRVAAQTGQMEVYVSLYNAKGADMKAWSRILMALSAPINTRPVYEDENHVRALIRSKANKKNEAYVAIYIQRDRLITLSTGDVPNDRLGHALLITKDNALDPGHITRFMHASGKYRFQDGQLVREGDMQYMDWN